MKLSPEWPEQLSRLVLIALAVVVFFFGILAAMPDSVWNGLLTGIFPKLRPDTPHIDLLSFTHERVPGELRLHLEIRNASTVPLDHLQAVVSIYDAAGKQLNTLVYPVEQPQIAPGQTVSLTLSFPESTPVIQYTVFFKKADGEIVPHTPAF
jgi:hypothetical protein